LPGFELHTLRTQIRSLTTWASLHEAREPSGPTKDAESHEKPATVQGPLPWSECPVGTAAGARFRYVTSLLNTCLCDTFAQ
jgi:hypothetical protein